MQTDSLRLHRSGSANTIGYSNGVQFEIVMLTLVATAPWVAQSPDTGRRWSMGSRWSNLLRRIHGSQRGAIRTGIPQVSYASTSPALSDATAYPSFYRVVPSDAFQGSVVAEVMTADAQDNVAVIHMTNAYGSGLADAFVANMDSASICTQIGYEETATDFSTIVSTVVNDGCTSVMMVSYR